MEKESVINSYFSPYSKRLILKDGEYKIQAEVITVFKKETIIEAFDSSGKSIGHIVSNVKHHETKNIETIDDINHRIVQYNYDFYFMPVGLCYNQSEVSEAESLLNKIWSDISCVRFEDYQKSKISDVVFKNLKSEQQDKIIKELNIIDYYSLRHAGLFRFEEVCIFGNTYDITSKNKIVDIEKYTANKEAAIKKWPNSKTRIEYLYGVNLGLHILKQRIKPVEDVNIKFIEDKYSHGTIIFEYKFENKKYAKDIKLNKFGLSGYNYVNSFKEYLKDKNIAINSDLQIKLRETELFIDDILKKPYIEIAPRYNYSRIEINPIKTYLIKDKKNNYYKIGKSANPMQREKTLQSEKPDIELVKTWDDNIESILHDFYKNNRIRGEWFNLTKSQVKFICTNNWSKQIENIN
jgi:hypothetical protein